jgi:hypothetical protein
VVLILSTVCDIAEHLCGMGHVDAVGALFGFGAECIHVGVEVGIWDGWLC